MLKRNPHRARIITSLNLKGGVGKTHACWLVAGVCQERGHRCLVLDLDKQGNISTSLQVDGATAAGTDQFFNASIDPEISSLIQHTALSNVDVIPGSFALERYNLTDPTDWEPTGLHRSLIDSLNEVAPFYDYILLDCPADISLITYAALCASSFLLVPLEAAQWGALGTQHVQKTLQHVQQSHNADLQLLGFVVSRFKKMRKYQSTYLSQIRSHFAEDAFDTVIPDLAPFEQSVDDRIPVVLHSPSSHAANIARQFFDELEARIKRLDRGGESVRASSLREPVEPETGPVPARNTPGAAGAQTLGKFVLDQS